jgi:hypothetical protein
MILTMANTHGRWRNLRRCNTRCYTDHTHLVVGRTAGGHIPAMSRDGDRGHLGRALSPEDYKAASGRWDTLRLLPSWERCALLELARLRQTHSLLQHEAQHGLSDSER